MAENNLRRVHFGIPEENFEKLLQSIKEEFDYVCKENKELSKMLRDWNKDDEIKKLRDLVEWHRLHSLQTLSDDEFLEIKKFRDAHYNSCGNSSTYQYELTGTGIGTIIKIRCPKCGQETDVTDYASW